MAAPSNYKIPESFWQLSKSSLDIKEWDIRFGSPGNEVIAIRANDYHPKILELTIDDINSLVKPLGYELTKLDDK